MWNLISGITPNEYRREILDWYHLVENLYKVGGSLQRLHQVETDLWNGRIAQARSDERGLGCATSSKLFQLSA